MAEAGFGQRDGVHVAFADNQPAALSGAERLAGRAVAVEDGRLVEEFGIARVQIFRLGIRRQAPAPEGDDGAAHVGDREHQAAAEKVERLASLVAFLDQAGFDQFLVGEALRVEVRPGAPPVVRRVAEAVALPGGGIEAAPVEVGAGRCAFA